MALSGAGAAQSTAGLASGINEAAKSYRQWKEINVLKNLKEGGSGADFYVTPGGTAIPKEYYHSLSDIDVRKWYLSQEATIPNLIDNSQSLEQQAYQAFSIRNEIRTTARELMADRQAAELLYINDPNKTWEQIIQRQIEKGLKGDDIYKAIIESSQRSRSSVNKSLGLE